MKKILNSLYITDDQIYLSLDGENIVCLKDGKEVIRVPFLNLESIYCFSYLGCSPALMGKCVKLGISLVFLSPQGRFLAKIIGETKGNVYLRKQQIECFDNTFKKTILIKNIIASKISNSIFVLNRTLRDSFNNVNVKQIKDAISFLKEIINNVQSEFDIDVLRGLEGSAAKRYFGVFNEMILKQKEFFSITSRTKRPPLDMVNAVLSFLYTIYTCDYASALEAVGLDSYIGFYHTLRPGRTSLACDMVEQGRSIVERFTITLINLKIINENDFDVQETGVVFLNDSGRKKVLNEWQNKKRTIIMHPIINEKIMIGLIPYVQSNLLAKYIRCETEDFVPYLMR